MSPTTSRCEAGDLLDQETVRLGTPDQLVCAVTLVPGLAVHDENYPARPARSRPIGQACRL